jgi:hypothetical protein
VYSEMWHPMVLSFYDLPEWAQETQLAMLRCVYALQLFHAGTFLLGLSLTWQGVLALFLAVTLASFWKKVRMAIVATTYPLRRLIHGSCNGSSVDQVPEDRTNL